ncbi:alginate lyase family protein [Dyella sp.]|uniref:alginate lyase family protein n=1 Tax=Dyella sp. TaxID=1869338 RepID=UPI002ED2681A
MKQWIVLALACIGMQSASAREGAFTHPGIFLDNTQIDAVRRNIAASHDVTTAALSKLAQSDLARLDYLPTPRHTVECGPFSKPDLGCTDETRDAQAAYTHALLWAYLGDERHAAKAIEIMNAWSSTLTGGHTLTNAGLQSSWAAELWPRSAELVRHTTSLWAPGDIERFERMLREQYLPDTRKMSACHVMNWQASAIEARMNIAVFLDDAALFDEAVEDWEGRLKSTIYLARDGALPQSHPACPKQGDALIADWFGQKVFFDGHGQETCRDLEHTAYGLAAFINAAETARIQGVDLYSRGADRLKAAMEYHARLKNDPVVPNSICAGKLVGDLTGTLEVGFNHYANRLGESLPQTASWLLPRRPTTGHFHYLWETLTHADTGTGAE